jgi:hypothetical protein
MLDRLRALLGAGVLNFRRRLALVAIVVAVLLGAGPVPKTAHAVTSAGACTLVSSGAATFSPPLDGVASFHTVGVGLTGSGACEWIAPSPFATVYLSIYLSGTLSCAGGEGSGAGTVAFVGALPSPPGVTATFVAGPGTLVLDVLYAAPGREFAGVLTLAWSPSAILACPTSPVSSTPLSGAFVFLDVL